MPLKLRYDAKQSKLVPIPGAWIDNEDGIKRDAERVLREQYTVEAEIELLRKVVIDGSALPKEYTDAVKAVDAHVAEKTKEAELQLILADEKACKAADAASIKEAMVSVGMVPIKDATKEQLEAAIKAASTNTVVGASK